jgi:hypothetical protein
MSYRYKGILNQGDRKNATAKLDRKRAFPKQFVRENVVRGKDNRTKDVTEKKVHENVD